MLSIIRCGSFSPLPRGLLQLIWPADDRSPMRSDAPRSVRSVGTTNRTVVVPVAVVVRICLANSHSPIWADASGSVDSIDTSGCVARLGEHERAKCNHDGEHRCAILGKAQCKVFHRRYRLDSRMCMTIILSLPKKQMHRCTRWSYRIANHQQIYVTVRRKEVRGLRLAARFRPILRYAPVILASRCTGTAHG